MYSSEKTGYQNNDSVFSAMVRLGKVTAADGEKRLAQVFFPDLNLSSGWIPVVGNRDETGTRDWAPKPWMPKVNDQVLCLYEPIRDGRGFVLGEVTAWQS
jgi:phage baseplate assembly protein gpV